MNKKVSDENFKNSVFQYFHSTPIDENLITGDSASLTKPLSTKQFELNIESNRSPRE